MPFRGLPRCLCTCSIWSHSLPPKPGQPSQVKCLFLRKPFPGASNGPGLSSFISSTALLTRTQWSVVWLCTQGPSSLLNCVSRRPGPHPSCSLLYPWPLAHGRYSINISWVTKCILCHSFITETYFFKSCGEKNCLNHQPCLPKALTVEPGLVGSPRGIPADILLRVGAGDLVWCDLSWLETQGLMIGAF